MLMTTSGGFPIQPVSAAAAAAVDLLVDRSVIYERKEERKENKEKKREYQIVQLTTLAAAAANTHGEAKEKVFISFFFYKQASSLFIFHPGSGWNFLSFRFHGRNDNRGFFCFVGFVFPDTRSEAGAFTLMWVIEIHLSNGQTSTYK
jgi:hypothetical protein